MAKARPGAAGAFYRHVGEQVRRLREDAGLRGNELAARVGLSRASIANLEAGKQAVPLHTFAAIAQVLGADVAALLPRPGAMALGDVTVAPDTPAVVRAFVEDVMGW